VECLLDPYLIPWYKSQFIRQAGGREGDNAIQATTLFKRQYGFSAQFDQEKSRPAPSISEANIKRG